MACVPAELEPVFAGDWPAAVLAIILGGCRDEEPITAPVADPD